MLENKYTKGDISLDGMKCLRIEYDRNECSLCMEICPYDALELNKNRRVSLNADRCVECKGCIGVCPTQAITNEAFDTNLFVVTFGAREEKRVSCKSNTPCLATFSIEQMLSMGLRKESLVCDLSNCATCEHNGGKKLEDYIVQNIADANEILGQMGVPNRIETDYEIPKTTHRRELFTKLASAIEEFSNDVEVGEIFDTGESIPVARQLLGNSLKKSVPLAANTLLKGDFKFTSNKQIDFASCTNCGDCIQFCPTKALTYSADQSKILFQPYRCIACGICEDICKPGSISSKEELDLVNFAFDRAMVAIEHRFVVCTECKTPFPQKGEETICARCKDFVTNHSSIFALAKDIG